MHPVICEFGPFTVYTYGVMVALAFIVSTLLMMKNAGLAGFPKDKVVDLMTVILVSGIIGARLLHVLANFDIYRENIFEIFMITKGGLAFHGGLIAAFAAGITFLKLNKIPVFSAGDLLAPYIALGQAIGRMGCFLNGCCYGAASDKITFGVSFQDGVLRYPTQLYESALLLAVYAVTRAMLQKRYLKGDLFFIYLFLYSAGRFFIEYFRGDVGRPLCGLTLAQGISAGIAVLAVTFILGRRVLWKDSSLR